CRDAVLWGVRGLSRRCRKTCRRWDQLMPRFSRRSLLAGASLFPVLPALDWLRPAAAAETETIPALGQPYPFDFERLRARAKALASRIYEPPRIRVPEILEDLGYLAHRDIAFRPEFEV